MIWERMLEGMAAAAWLVGFVMIAAIQAVFAGLILKNITQKNRQDFEMRLLEVRERKGEK